MTEKQAMFWAWNDALSPFLLQRRPVDHARNRNLLTATRLVTALGYGYGSPGDAIAWDADVEESWQMRRGTVLEPGVLAWIRDGRAGVPDALRGCVWVTPDWLGTARHPFMSWAASSPDALVIGADGRRYVLEVKSRAQAGRYFDAEGEETVSPGERIQVLWNMACCQAEAGWLVADTPRGLLFRSVEATQAELASLEEDAALVWQAIRAGDPLALLAVVSEASARSVLVREHYTKPEHASELTDWPEGLDVSEDAERLSTLKEEAKAIEAQIGAIQTRIQVALGGRQRAESDSWRASWPLITRAGVDLARLRADRPDIAEQYRTETSYRGALRLTRTKR